MFLCVQHVCVSPCVSRRASAYQSEMPCKAVQLSSFRHAMLGHEKLQSLLPTPCAHCAHSASRCCTLRCAAPPPYASQTLLPAHCSSPPSAVQLPFAAHPKPSSCTVQLPSLRCTAPPSCAGAEAPLSQNNEVCNEPWPPPGCATASSLLCAVPCAMLPGRCRRRGGSSLGRGSCEVCDRSLGCVAAV